MRHWLFLFLVSCISLLSIPVRAQVVRSANGDTPHLWVGAEYSNFKPDYGMARLPGLGIFANMNLLGRFGVEGEARFLTFTKPLGLTEKSYLIGPNATVFRYARFSANIRFVGGVGLVTYPLGIGYGSYFEFAPAGDVEYQFSHRWRARFDYEHQFIPSAPGLPGMPDNGLTPAGYSGGISYRIR